MKFMRKTPGLLFLAVIVAFLVMPLSNAQAAKIIIKITTVQMPVQQMGKFALDFAKNVKNDPFLKDKVEVRAYPSAQLYSGEQELSALSRGELEMAFVIGSKPEVLDPAFQVLNLPYLFPSVEVGLKVLTGETGRKYLWSKFDKHNIRFMGIVFSGSIIISNSKRPVLMPADFVGLKLRSYGRMAKSMLEDLGANAIVTASEETFGALQQGMIDGAIVPDAVYLARKYYTIQKYVSVPGMINFSNGQLLANTGFWNGLPSDVRSRLEAMLDKMLAENNREYISQDKNVLKTIAAKGNEVSYLTPEQQKAWAKATEKMYDEYGPEIGEGLIDHIRAAIKATTE